MAASFAPYTDMIQRQNTKDYRGPNEVLIYGEITFDTSYPTGGEVITAAIINAGLSNPDISALKRIIPFGRSADYKYSTTWNDTDAKLLCWLEDQTSGVSAQVGDGVNIATVAIPVIVVATPT